MASKAGRVQIQLEAQVTKLQNDLDKATRLIENSAVNWKRSFTDVFTGNVASEFFTRLTDSIRQTIQDLGDIADKSAALGDTAEMFQRLAFAAEQSGVAMESVVSASGRLQKNLGEGGEKAAEAFGKLNLSIEELRRLSPGEAFIKVAGALGEVQDKARQAAIGSAIFGKGWQALMPLMAQGENALRAMVNQARVASDEAVKAADEYGDKVAEMQGAVKVFIAEALQPMLPLLTKSAQEFTNVAGSASGAADGIDRSTSSARQLGQTLASMLESLAAFRDILNHLQDASVQAVKGWKWPWEDETVDPVNHVEELANAWSRFTTHFNDVQSSITTSYDTTAEAQAKARAQAEAAAEAAEEAAKSEAKRATAIAKKTAARKEDNRAEKEALELARQFEQIRSDADSTTDRYTDLINARTIAIERFNGVTEDQITLNQMWRDLATDDEIEIVRQTQAWDAATKARMDRQQEQAAQAQQYADILSHGFDDIFGAMTEGSDAATQAVIRLIAELTTLYLTQQALQALGFNAGGSWGFQGVAKGGAFDQRGMIPFAQGGVFFSPTPFTFGGGKLGVLGEAGPEAVMPLTRDASGRLGVRNASGGVNVNVHNYGRSNVQVQQNGNDIAIIVDQVRGVLASDIARGGNVLAGSIEGAYGLRR